MNREIKFRGQKSDNKEWTYGYYQFTIYSEAYKRDLGLNQDNAHQIYPAHIDSSPKEVLPETVGQFTGLKDKNGVDIYEGDICLVLYTDWPSKAITDMRSPEEYMESIAKKGVVIWNYNQFKFHFYGEKGGDSTGSTIVGQHGFVKVIGDIHSNTDPR